MLTQRCSRLPLALACPASQVLPALVIERMGDDAARMGSAVHELITSGIAGTRLEKLNVAAKWRVDNTDELKKLRDWGWNAWESIREYFPQPQVEREFAFANEDEGFLLKGKADVFSENDGKMICIADFKSGWADKDHRQQLRGYAMLALHEFPGAESVYCVVPLIRQFSVDRWLWTRQEVEAWYASAITRLKQIDVYAPSYESCTYCPRAHECPARFALLRECIAFVEEFAGKSPGEMAELDADMLIEARGKKAFVEKACDALGELTKLEVKLHGGTMVGPSGRELHIKTVEAKHIAARNGLPVLVQSGIDWGELLDLAKLPKGKIEALAKGIAPHGEKGRFWQAIMARLEEAEAIEITTSERLEVKPAVESMGEIHHGNGNAEPAASFRAC